MTEVEKIILTNQASILSALSTLNVSHNMSVMLSQQAGAVIKYVERFHVEKAANDA